MKINIHGLAFKQSMAVFAGISIVFAALFFFSNSQIQGKLSQMLLQKGEEVSRANVALINKLFSSGRTFGEEVAYNIGTQNLSAAELDDYLLRTLSGVRATVPQVVAMVAAFEPGMAPDSSNQEYMRLAYFSGDSTTVINGGNYHEKIWYKSTKDSLRGLWQEPFIGDFIKEPIVIFTTPIFRTDSTGEKKFAGVLCVDISIAFLKDMIANMPVSNDGYAVVLSASNLVIAHPKNELTFKANFASLSRNASHRRLVEFENAVHSMKHGLFLGTSVDGEDAAIYFSAMESIDWTFLIVWPANKYMEEQRSVSHMYAWISFGGYALIFILILVITFRASRPLKALAVAADKLGHGDFSAEIPVVTGHDEISLLAGAFTDMRTSLQKFIETQKDMDRSRRDLEFSRSIQLGILSKNEVEEGCADNRHALAPFLLPALDAGGDYYDFFKLDDDHLLVLIADVAGKGVPATLVMMVSRIVIRTLALHHTSVSEIFNETNDGLMSHNRDQLFVTAWMGIIDLRTGHMEFASAGHKAPAIRRKDGSVAFVNSVPDVALVVKEDFSYNTQTLDLNPGDTLFMYTDGLTNARNADGTIFGKDELLRALAESGNRAPAEINSFMKERLDHFTGDAQQLDDIAMLTLRYDGVAENS